MAQLHVWKHLIIIKLNNKYIFLKKNEKEKNHDIFNIKKTSEVKNLTKKKSKN